MKTGAAKGRHIIISDGAHRRFKLLAQTSGRNLRDFLELVSLIFERERLSLMNGQEQASYLEGKMDSAAMELIYRRTAPADQAALRQRARTALATEFAA